MRLTLSPCGSWKLKKTSSASNSRRRRNSRPLLNCTILSNSDLEKLLQDAKAATLYRTQLTYLANQKPKSSRLSPLRKPWSVSLSSKAARKLLKSKRQSRQLRQLQLGLVRRKTTRRNCIPLQRTLLNLTKFFIARRPSSTPSSSRKASTSSSPTRLTELTSTRQQPPSEVLQAALTLLDLPLTTVQKELFLSMLNLQREALSLQNLPHTPLSSVDQSTSQPSKKCSSQLAGFATQNQSSGSSEKLGSAMSPTHGQRHATKYSFTVDELTLPSSSKASLTGSNVLPSQQEPSAIQQRNLLRCLEIYSKELPFRAR